MFLVRIYNFKPFTISSRENEIRKIFKSRIRRSLENSQISLFLYLAARFEDLSSSQKKIFVDIS